MTTTRFATLVGLFLGAIWVFAGFWEAVLVAVIAGLAFLIALIVEGRIDVTDYLGHRHDDV